MSNAFSLDFISDQMSMFLSMEGLLESLHPFDFQRLVLLSPTKDGMDSTT